MLGFIEGNDQQAVDALTNRLIPWWGSKPLIAEDYGYGRQLAGVYRSEQTLVQCLALTRISDGCWVHATYAAAATIAEGRSTLAPGAEGAFDGQWTALATQLIDAGMADAVIRLGWEFNGTGSPGRSEPIRRISQTGSPTGVMS